MKSGILALLIASAVASGPARALDIVSRAWECIKENNRAYSCGEAYAQISASEANNFTAIHVQATFNSPGNSVAMEASKNVATWNPFTWKVRVEKGPVYCAGAGTHETNGHHVADIAGTSLSYDTYDSFFRHYCDCNWLPE
jgi:hypothetical protein